MTIGERNERADFTPSEAWIDAFKEQCTDEMRIHAKRYAVRRLHGVGKAGGHVDDYAAREIVQDVIGDTLFGVVAWDPANKSLQQHIEDVIHSRTFHIRKRARKYPHQRIDAFDPPSERFPTREEIEASLTSVREQPGLDVTVRSATQARRRRERGPTDQAAARRGGASGDPGRAG